MHQLVFHCVPSRSQYHKIPVSLYNVGMWTLAVEQVIAIRFHNNIHSIYGILGVSISKLNTDKKWMLQIYVCPFVWFIYCFYKLPHTYSGPSLIRASNNRLLGLSGLDLCIFYLMLMLRTEQTSCIRLLEHPKMLECWPFEAQKGWNTVIVCTDDG